MVAYQTRVWFEILLWSIFAARVGSTCIIIIRSNMTVLGILYIIIIKYGAFNFQDEILVL